jgi:hypothetical protein
MLLEQKQNIDGRPRQAIDAQSKQASQKTPVIQPPTGEQVPFAPESER